MVVHSSSLSSFSDANDAGHGLSFSSFAYSNLHASATEVSIDVSNTGKLAAADIPQLYLGFPPASGEPPKQLKGFKKTAVLAPGEKTNVKFPLVERDLSIWDTTKHGWVKQSGTFQVFVGASSEDTQATGSFEV